jgi:DNA-binding response OmpR family regulator
VIRVLIAEDMHMIRGALVALLSLEDDMEVVAELDRGDQIVGVALRTRPDVAVIDIDLPGMDGLTSPGTCCGRSRCTRAGSSSRTPPPRRWPTASGGWPGASG